MKSNRIKLTTLVSLILLPSFQSKARAAILYLGVGSPTQATGSISGFTPAGGRFNFATGLSGPYGLAFDAGGNLYEADYGTDTIYKFTSAGARSTFALVGPGPEGLTFDKNGNLFVACFDGIHKITPSGSASLFVPLSHGFYSNAGGLVFDTAGNLLVANYGVGGSSGGVLRITPNGAFTAFASGISGAYGLAFDAHGNLFVSEFATGIIYKYAQSGDRTTFATGLSDPEDLRVDSSGNLFEVDNASGNVYKFTSTGSRSLFAGGFATGVAGPHSLAFGPVPEPSTWLLAALGAMGLWRLHRRQGRSISVNLSRGDGDCTASH
jgi:sugar lactone lactonase YvrE